MQSFKQHSKNEGLPAEMIKYVFLNVATESNFVLSIFKFSNLEEDGNFLTLNHQCI